MTLRRTGLVVGLRSDWKEYSSELVFRLWRWVRPLLVTVGSSRMAFICSLVGVALAAIAFSFADLVAWPTMVLAVLGVFVAVGYAIDGFAKRLSMQVASGQDSNITARDFLYAPQWPDEGYRLVQPKNERREQLYPYVDLSDHSLFIQLENDLTREQRAALYARWYNLCPNEFMHLEKLVDGQWRPISVSIVLPLSDTGFNAITQQKPRRRISVVDLDRAHILRGITNKHPFLLIDTWIVDREGGYGGAGHGKSDTRGGNANLLVLRNIAQFWNSANRFRATTFLVETGWCE